MNSPDASKLSAAALIRTALTSDQPDGLTVNGCTIRTWLDNVRVRGDRSALEALGLLPDSIRFPGDVPGKKGGHFRDANGRVCRLSRTGSYQQEDGPFCLTIKRSKVESNAAVMRRQRIERDDTRLRELERLIDTAPVSKYSARWRMEESVRAACTFLKEVTVEGQYHCSLDDTSHDVITDALEDIAAAMRDATFKFDDSARTALVRERNYLQARNADPTYRNFMTSVLAPADETVFIG